MYPSLKNRGLFWKVNQCIDLMTKDPSSGPQMHGTFQHQIDYNVHMKQGTMANILLEVAILLVFALKAISHTPHGRNTMISN